MTAKENECVLSYCRKHPSEMVPEHALDYFFRYNPGLLVDHYPGLAESLGARTLDQLFAILPLRVRNLINGNEFVIGRHLESGWYETSNHWGGTTRLQGDKPMYEALADKTRSEEETRPPQLNPESNQAPQRGA
jgi:hypothetical protein